MQTRYAAVLRVSFVSVGAPWEKALYRDIYFKILPKGSAQVPGILLGYPVLDPSPAEGPKAGLGHVVTQDSHYFAELGASLPRGELLRREQQREEIEEWRRSCGASCRCSSPHGSGEKMSYLSDEQVSLLKQAVRESEVPGDATE